MNNLQVISHPQFGMFSYIIIDGKEMFKAMKSSEMRNNALFTRNQFNPVGKWNIPLVKKQEIPSINPSLVSINDTRSPPSSADMRDIPWANTQTTVHQRTFSAVLEYVIRSDLFR